MRLPAVVRLAAAAIAIFACMAQAAGTAEPRRYDYRQVDGRALSAYVFAPAGAHRGKPGAAVLLFHGGGWVAGSAEWTFDQARRFAALGLTAIAVDYRLSDDTTTPIDALADVCASFAWARRQADALHVDRTRIAGHGVSAGGQLVSAAATGRCPADSGNARPDLLLLVSPAVDVGHDGWFKKLLRGRGEARDYAAAEHADANTPPTLIAQGSADTLTPAAGARRFCAAMQTLGRECEIAAYDNLGHLLTRNLGDQERNFDPDPAAIADAGRRQERFLRAHGYLSPIIDEKTSAP